MKKMILVTMILISLAFLAGGDNSDTHGRRQKIEDIAKGLPADQRELVDSILITDRRINAGVDVINDISRK